MYIDEKFFNWLNFVDIVMVLKWKKIGFRV